MALRRAAPLATWAGRWAGGGMGGQMGGGGMGGSVGSNGSSRAHTPPPVAAGAGYRGWRLPAGTVWVEAEEQRSKH